MTSDPSLSAPLARAIEHLIEPCLEEGWEAGDIAGFVANQLRPQPDRNNPLRWWITLPSADGTGDFL